MAKKRGIPPIDRKGERGYALAMVLVFMVLGGLIIAPFLGFMSTGHRTGVLFEDKTRQLYAADAGIEDGKWHIRYDKLPGYDPYDYDTEWSYNLTDEDGGQVQVNGYDVAVTIQNVWMPMGIDVPDPATARQIIEDGTLIITGGLSGTRAYELRISWGCGDGAVETIGIWLPPGFEYDGECSLEGETYYSEPAVTPHRGGYAVVWNFPSSPVGFPGSFSFTFQYSGPDNQAPGAAISWIVTDAETGGYAWDADTRIYRILSVAGDTEVEAYVPRGEMRELGSAVAGDYVAIGNSLLTPTGNINYRNQLHKQSTASIQNNDPTKTWNYVPATATVEAAYLYWTGWIDYRYREQVGWWSWVWREIPQLKYGSPNTEAQLIANAKVDTVSFGAGGSMQDITTPHWQIFPSTGAEWAGSWIYACYYDATDIVKNLIEEEKVSPCGSGTYTLGHADSVVNVKRPGAGADTYYFDLYNTGQKTGYPLGTPAHTVTGSGTNYPVRYQYSHAGWSLIIIYSDPETDIKNQLYLYDIMHPNFVFTEAWAPGGIPNLDFDGSGEGGGTISGFLVPTQIPDDTNVAKITCFVGEGDEDIPGDYVKITGPSGISTKLWDGEYVQDNTPANPNNVWNSKSPGVELPGIDIDTFYVTWASNILSEGDTWAHIDLVTGSDGFTLVYIIVSFRSEITTGGSLGYMIR